MEKQKVLIIEDDAAIREGVRILLEGEGFEVVEAENGLEGLKCLDKEISIVILDIMMPGISGFRTCEKIREVSNVPVLFLTARSDESDKLLGLTAGGDDYLIKPFSYAELLARVKALLRRYMVYDRAAENETAEKEYLERKDIRISLHGNQIWKSGREISLSTKEYQILRLLMKNVKHIYSLEEIYESVWQERFSYDCGNTVMVHIRKLRLKVENDPQKPDYVCTVWGKGYRFGC